jgi:hypothetical protein
MTTTPNPKPIHALIGLTHMTDGVLGPILDASLKGLLDNAKIYNKPPVDLNDYANAITVYKASIPASLDGSKTATAQKNKLRRAVIKLYKQLAHYAESECNDDMAIFLLSGFQPKSTTKTQSPPTSEAVRKAVPGKTSGSVDITLMSVLGAKSYNVRHAPVPPGGAPTNWTIVMVGVIRPPTTITGLTPGTVYAFQAQAVMKDGPTDWSDSVTLMCT